MQSKYAENEDRLRKTHTKTIRKKEKRRAQRNIKCRRIEEAITHKVEAKKQQNLRENYVLFSSRFACIY